MSYYRKGENTPSLTGRAARRFEQRAQARAEQRPGRPVIGHKDRAIVAAHNAGLTTAAQYLHNIGFAEADRFASAFGRECAKAYRANHNAEPPRAFAIGNGRIRCMFAYTNPLDLIAGALAYGRTADLVLTVPGHPVARQFAGV